METEKNKDLDKIKVIERTTVDIQKETAELFNKIRPHLDNGESYLTACRIVLKIQTVPTHSRWYRDLVEYAESQGYHRKDYKYKKRGKIVERTTADRQKETAELFCKIKPLLDNGVPFTHAVKKAKGGQNFNTNAAWYRDLKEYAVSQGYLVFSPPSYRG